LEEENLVNEILEGACLTTVDNWRINHLMRHEPLNDRIEVRTPSWFMKEIKRIAKDRGMNTADITREALRIYLERERASREQPEVKAA
jgi:hypothetical protein